MVDGGIHQGEGSAVQGDPQHCLVSHCAQLEEVLESVVNIQDLVLC